MSTDHLSISDLTGAACLGNAGSGQAPILSYLRKRYGNHAETVIQIMKAWETYGELFSEWRGVWEGDSDEYRAKRALRLARAARDFQAALTSLSNYSEYKQKSWYTHATTWIAWQQIFDYGNTWALSTISIESRNARIKKYGRRFTNWRPLVEGFTSYSYQDRGHKQASQASGDTTHQQCTSFCSVSPSQKARGMLATSSLLRISYGCRRSSDRV
jgi:hypothetical protein